MLTVRQNVMRTHVKMYPVPTVKSTNMGTMPTGVAVISFGMVTVNESVKLVFEICTMNIHIHTYIHTHTYIKHTYIYY
jgi:hypothetical protein